MEIPEKILSRRLVTEKGCWEWQGVKNIQGYGYVSFNGRKYLVHRYVFCILNNLSLNTVFKILHKCDNPPCFNPEHLVKGTSRDNTRDAIRKGRFSSNRGKDWRNR
jgi:hypothetical protein